MGEAARQVPWLSGKRCSRALDTQQTQGWGTNLTTFVSAASQTLNAASPPWQAQGKGASEQVLKDQPLGDRVGWEGGKESVPGTNRGQEGKVRERALDPKGLQPL